MRWFAKDPWRWRTGFAWFPLKIENQWVWLERYEWQDHGEYCFVRLLPK